ncbi:hypothetical protein MTP99_009338 [Tenebrio molitor]|nr:hypothetical protein MTP99_009338 [Tenebrio molitor]
MGKEVDKMFNTCRACLSLSDNTYPIFDTISQFNVNIITMLNNFSLEILEDDDFPKVLCLSCIAKLQAAYDFIETFKKSQDFLDQHYLKKCEENVTIVNEDEETTGDNIEGYLDTDSFQDNSGNIFNSGEIDTESFIIKCENSDRESVHESDDQDFLIEQSVKLTRQYRIHKLDNEDQAEQESDDSEEVQNPTNEQNTTLENQYEKFRSLHGLFLSCPVCSKTFKRFRAFSVHLAEHNKDITCKLCAVQFDDANLYLEHYQKKHRYQCNICEKSFPRGDTYNRHMQAHNNTLPQFVCPVENCTKTFTVRQSLRNHFKTIHSEKRNFLCNMCGASFKNYDNLRYHMKKHKGPSHLCPYCGKAFMQSVHLTYHMWRHTGVKPYKCTKCDKSFVSKKVLTAHLDRNCEKTKKGKQEAVFLDIDNI